jgi:hypothetical protein
MTAPHPHRRHGVTGKTVESLRTDVARDRTRGSETAIPAKSKKRAGRATRTGPSRTSHAATRPSSKTPAKNRLPGTVLALLILTAIQAIGAIGGGIGLVRDPIKNIGMPISMLEGSPFKDYLIPGLILLIVVGLFALFVLAGLLRRWTPAWWLSLASGGGLIVWIIVEAALLGYLPGAGIGLQVAFGLIGVAIVVLDLLRPTRRYYRVTK